MNLSDRIRAEAGPFHVHTDQCPPACPSQPGPLPAWQPQEAPELREVPSGPLTPGPGPDGLPQVLWRVALATPDRGPDRPAVAWFELEGDAVHHLESCLDMGWGLTSVHRLDLYPPTPDDRRIVATWRELQYVPPARGRLIVKPS